MTGDGLPEVIVSSTACGANTCFETYDVIGAPTGVIGSIIFSFEGGEPNNSFTELRVEDWDGDNLPDMIIYGGTVGGVGGGPAQRATSQIWAWDPDFGAVVRVADVADDSELRYHMLVDANELFRQELYREAIGKYELVAYDETLVDIDGFLTGSGTTEGDAKQFALFRLMLSYAMLGEPISSDAYLTELMSRYPGDPITVGAERFGDIYLDPNREDVVAGCIAATDYFLTQPNPAGVVENLGYVWPTLDAESICPVRG